MSLTLNNSPATTQQTPIQAPVSNAQAVYVLAATPALTTSITANTTVEVTFPITGIQLSDVVFLNKNSYSAGLSIGNIRVTTANQIQVEFINNTASPILLLVGDTYSVIVIRPIAQQVTNGLPTALPLP